MWTTRGVLVDLPLAVRTGNGRFLLIGGIGLVLPIFVTQIFVRHR